MADRLEMEAGFRVDPSGLNQMETMAKQAGGRISGALSGTTAGYSTAAGSMIGGGGRGGIIGETVVLFRELGRGNYSRIPGSVTILAQRMGVLKYMVKDTTLESEKYAIALSHQAEKAEAVATIAQHQAAQAKNLNLVDMTRQQLRDN